ncbi:MAG: alkene reductase [Burkholderiales bacterium]|jgi:2,4-dienoyl-CoA reductase-like NADH-dependent reductase (Old Yellow Enzyme family)|nr:alkene reductase [Burkholderiales bacterium]
MSVLFSSLKVGGLTLPNRIIMAPLTRCRSSDGRVPNAMMAEYYAQRSGAGLIISEATSVSPMGVGYPRTPGIWSDEQIDGWKLVTDAVHKADGKMFLQLWHVGRISDPFYLDGKLPIAPSAIASEGHVSLLRPVKQFVTPRSIELSEIPGIIEEFRIGALNAKKAGFDGVEIHGANGYLLDQFLQDISNKRTDEYGGVIENRARLMLEITDAVISVWSPGRVGMHLAPQCDSYSMGDSDPLATFSYVAKELGKRKIAFICAREKQDENSIGSKLKEAFGGVYIINQNLTQEDATRIIDSGNADAAAWGQLFIANPDLPERFRQKTELNKPDPQTFYAEGAHGYTDYKMMDFLPQSN